MIFLKSAAIYLQCYPRCSIQLPWLRLFHNGSYIDIVKNIQNTIPISPQDILWRRSVRPSRTTLPHHIWVRIAWLCYSFLTVKVVHLWLNYWYWSSSSPTVTPRVQSTPLEVAGLHRHPFLRHHLSLTLSTDNGSILLVTLAMHVHMLEHVQVTCHTKSDAGSCSDSDMSFFIFQL